MSLASAADSSGQCKKENHALLVESLLFVLLVLLTLSFLRTAWILVWALEECLWNVPVVILSDLLRFCSTPVTESSPGELHVWHTGLILIQNHVNYGRINPLSTLVHLTFVVWWPEETAAALVQVSQQSWQFSIPFFSGREGRGIWGYLKNEACRRNKQTACSGIRVINLGQALLPKES